MTRGAIAVAIAAIAAAACGTQTTELVDDALPGLVALAITPTEEALELTDLRSELAVELIAIGRFRDGSERDVTTEVTWTTDRDDAGRFVEPGRWIGSNRTGGAIVATARSGAIAADARLIIHVRLEVTDPAFPPPAGAADAFAPPTPVVVGDPMRSPRVIYPADQVMVPLDLYPLRFQYDRGAGDVFRLRFRSTYLALDVFTTSDRWLPDPALWDLLTRTSAGDVAVLTVAGVEAARPMTIWESRPIDVHVADAAVPGAIYYWSSASQGVMRAALAQATATRFDPPTPGPGCVGCHALARDGRRLAAGYDGERLQEVTVPGRAIIIPRGRDAGWSTFSPDGRRLLTAHHGALLLLDADTGATVGAAGGVVDAGGPATHPDWSPLGDQVVVARCGRADDDRNVERCALVRLPFAADGFGPPELLVPTSGPGDNNFFPRYSPDGAWIAYVRADGKSRLQPTAELRMIPAGGGAPFTLARANHRVGPQDVVSNLANTMPAWAPATARGIQWLAFASTRDYGRLLVGAKPSQLWIAAIDPSRTGDPSFAAFWVPFQDPDQRNHRPAWALDPARPCPGGVEQCDGFDNDCDGLIDDACAPTTTSRPSAVPGGYRSLPLEPRPSGS